MADDGAVFGTRKQKSLASRRGANRTIPMEWFDPTVSNVSVPRLFCGSKIRGVVRFSVSPRSKTFENFREHRFGNRGAGDGPMISKFRYSLALVVIGSDKQLKYKWSRLMPTHSHGLPCAMVITSRY